MNIPFDSCTGLMRHMSNRGVALVFEYNKFQKCHGILRLKLLDHKDAAKYFAEFAHLVKEVSFSLSKSLI